MAKFFIDRPIFAWVIALFIMIAGAVSISRLSLMQYPQVAPPTINLRVVYPGASAKTIDESVLSIIEREMNGIEHLDYMQSKAMANGTGSLTLVFESGTQEDLAQVDVQNRLTRAEMRLPAIVKQMGISVDKARSNFLLIASFQAKNGQMDTDAISDYVARHVVPQLQRIQGLGGVQLFGSEKAMRIWLDPERLKSFGLTTQAVNQAIVSQNIQIPAGAIGALPATAENSMQASIIIPGQMEKVEEFENIVLVARTDGSSVKLKDVARVEIGLQGYVAKSRLNGQPAVFVGVQLSNEGNAVEASAAVRDKMSSLERYFPEGLTWGISFDSSNFVKISLQKVLQTLLEAVVLVFLVMLVFLQNFRYTIIPAIVVPIALLGAVAVMYALNMSLNVLTMFAMVLVIGIVVDDAIVVVENVERIMREEGLPPLEATRKAMTQISGAVVGITVVLISVFIPMAFFPGSTGNIYRQFSLVMAVAIFFSAFMALSLTPALCATLLKPITDEHEEKRGFFGWFNRRFSWLSRTYESNVGRWLARGKRVLMIYLILIFAAGFVLTRLPTAFLPQEDQGFVIAGLELPPEATETRTSEAMSVFERFTLAQPEVESVTAIVGFGFNGQGQNVGMSFIALKDWHERKGAQSGAAAVAKRISGAMMAQLKDGFLFAVPPAAIPELGAFSGFSFQLQDRAGLGHEALINARNQLMQLARQSGKLVNVRPEGMADAPQLKIEIDRDRAAAQGVSFAAVGQTLGTQLGSEYVNDFLNQGRLQRVIVQADAVSRMGEEDVMKMMIPNQQGQLVPLSSIATAQWVTGPMELARYNGYPAVSITGAAAAGLSSGDAIEEMTQLFNQLPAGFGFEWAGQTREEIAAGSKQYILYAFSILAVFLCLAALYESWTIPLSVLLVVPLGFLGVVLGIGGRYLYNALLYGTSGYANDVYFQVGLITVIGLSAKNAILIVEFAKDLQAQGYNPFKAALASAHLRFRPIIMTSMAFIMGVLPLYFSSGASSASQRAIGTAVLWGMLIGTFLSVFFVPMFYAAVRTFFHHTKRQNERFTAHSTEAGMNPDLADRYIAEAERDLSAEEKQTLNSDSRLPKPPKDED